MRFGVGGGAEHTLEEVGKTFTVTRERIRQIESKALRKLRHPSRSKALRVFSEDPYPPRDRPNPPKTHVETPVPSSESVSLRLDFDPELPESKKAIFVSALIEKIRKHGSKAPRFRKNRDLEKE